MTTRSAVHRFVYCSVESFAGHSFRQASAGVQATAVLALVPPVNESPLRLGVIDTEHLAFLRGTSVAQVVDELRESTRLEALDYDDEVHVVRCRQFWCGYPPTKLSTFRWLLRFYAQVPECALKDTHIVEMRTFARRGGKAYVAAINQAQQPALGPMPQGQLFPVSVLK